MKLSTQINAAAWGFTLTLLGLCVMHASRQPSEPDITVIVDEVDTDETDPPVVKMRFKGRYYIKSGAR